MRMIDELVVRGEPDQMAAFKARLETAPGDAWERRTDYDIVHMSRSWMRPTIGFRSLAGSTHRSVIAWLSEERPDEFRLGGTMSGDRKPMSDEEHNISRREFADFIRPLADEVGVEVQRIPFRVKMEQIVTFEAMWRLETFVKEAVDKARLTPFDRARWRRFVTQVHRDSSALYGEELELWLKMGEWPEEVRRTLVDEYDLGLTLLKEYDEERVG